MSLDDATIRELIGFSDDEGVLSFYVGHTPEQAADPQPTTPIEIRNGIRELLGRLEASDASLARAVSDRIDRLNGDLSGLLDPKAHGRGRALFVAVGSGETRQVALQIPFRDRVIHHDSAFVRPLIAAYDEGRPAGVLVASRRGTRLLRWSVGEIEEVEREPFFLTDAQLADKTAGQSPSKPGAAQHGMATRDRIGDRIDENLFRFLRSVVDRASQRAQKEGWDRLVVSAPPKLRDHIGPMFHKDGSGAAEDDPLRRTRVLFTEQAFEEANPASIAEGIWPLLRSVARDRESLLVQTATERALGGGAGALGMRQVCEALNQGRVAHLLHDVDLQVEGFRSDEDTLHPRVEGVVAESDLDLHREPLFVERMVEKAVATSAAVTPVEESAAQALQEHEGIAALLRW